LAMTQLCKTLTPRTFRKEFMFFWWRKPKPKPAAKTLATAKADFRNALDRAITAAESDGLLLGECQDAMQAAIDQIDRIAACGVGGRRRYYRLDPPAAKHPVRQDRELVSLIRGER
jgi:hypothetical protein